MVKTNQINFNKNLNQNGYEIQNNKKNLHLEKACKFYNLIQTNVNLKTKLPKYNKESLKPGI